MTDRTVAVLLDQYGRTFADEPGIALADEGRLYQVA
jgi:hypothetical protein